MRYIKYILWKRIDAARQILYKKKKKKKEILTRICLNEYNIKHFKPVKIR